MNWSSYEILDGQSSDNWYRVVNDNIYYKDWNYLVLESQWKMKIIQTSHDSPLTWHLGFLKTYRTIRETFTWKVLKRALSNMSRNVVPIIEIRLNIYTQHVCYNCCPFQNKMVECLHGFHYKDNLIPMKILYLHHGRLVDEVYPLVCDFLQKLCILDNINIFPRSILSTWFSKNHCQWQW